MSILDDIMENKRKEVQGYKNLYGEHIAKDYESAGSFIDALRKPENLAVIAEIKRKSPSQGKMAEEEDPVEIAGLYEASGVNAISVLTDQKFFGGSFDVLEKISHKVKIPLLCKDFIIDRIQIDLAAISSASAVLLITEILDDESLLDLYEYAGSLGLDALVEAYFPQNVKRAVELGAEIIGINNRNHTTLEENPRHAEELAHHIPSGIVKLSLSSCKDSEDAIRIAKAGFDGILVGGVIMKSKDRSAAIKNFLNIPKI
jgi:indole-3-glycerol phosphate synthase